MNVDYYLLAEETVILRQAADELSRYDREVFAGRMTGQ
jgi:hypothetical protein